MGCVPSIIRKPYRLAALRFIDFSGKWAIVGQHKFHLRGVTNPARQSDGRIHYLIQRNYQTGMLNNDHRRSTPGFAN
jgi:hypothetical protein